MRMIKDKSDEKKKTSGFHPYDSWPPKPKDKDFKKKVDLPKNASYRDEKEYENVEDNTVYMGEEFQEELETEKEDKEDTDNSKKTH